MKIALCQFDIVWENKRANKDKIISLLKSSSLRADWIIFPEMTLSGFSMNAGAALLDDNNFLTLDKEGKLISNCGKTHLVPWIGEDKIYKSGVKAENFMLNGMSVSPSVCYDLRFSYLFWNAAAQTDIFAVMASWPASRSGHWSALLKARAIENLCYVAGVNRIGKDPNCEYSGGSAVFGPFGETLLDCGKGEGVFTCETEITKKSVEEIRAKFPFIKDRKDNLCAS
ncbi:MAG: hypothetical protein NTW04_05910 [Elusimicrobia bacterium]|nr:hypothetical protein [Elusimicrobiota bacterium]